MNNIFLIRNVYIHTEEDCINVLKNAGVNINDNYIVFNNIQHEYKLIITEYWWKLIIIKPFSVDKMLISYFFNNTRHKNGFRSAYYNTKIFHYNLQLRVYDKKTGLYSIVQDSHGRRLKVLDFHKNFTISPNGLDLMLKSYIKDAINGVVS